MGEAKTALGYSVGYLSLSGSEKLFKPAYMSSYLKTYELCCEKIMTTPDSSHIDAAVDVLISFVPSANEKERLYTLKQQYLHDTIAEAEKQLKRTATDNEKVALRRNANLKVVAKVNEAMSSTLGFSYNRKIGIIGEYGDVAGFVSEADLPEDIRKKMLERIVKVDHEDEPASDEVLADEGQTNEEGEP